MNTWLLPPENFLPSIPYQEQTVERIEIIAYLKDGETLTAIDYIFVNNELKDIDLKGRKPSDFRCLETEIQYESQERGWKELSFKNYFK